MNSGLVRGFKGFRGRAPRRAGSELIGFELCRGEGGEIPAEETNGSSRPLCFVSPEQRGRECFGGGGGGKAGSETCVILITVTI